jgi:Tfp pilus assembly protein PilF
MALVGINQDEKAIKVLTKAVKNDPKDERSWLHLALAKRNLEDFEDARKDVAKVLAISPNNEDALMLNADILKKAGHISAALDAGRKALKIVPSNINLLKLTATLSSGQRLTMATSKPR